MFHMLSCFNLGSDTSVKDFQNAVDRFTQHLLQHQMLESTGPIGRRQRHPVMDTDDERDLEYYFIMSFRDRQQCDQAVAHIFERQEPGESIHSQVYKSITDSVFVCWEDIA